MQQKRKLKLIPRLSCIEQFRRGGVTPRVLFAKDGTHIVKSGETLSAIAKKNNTTVDELATLNRIEDPDQLYIGQELKIPTVSQSTKTTDQSTDRSSNKASTAPRPATSGGAVAPYTYYESMDNAQQEYGVAPLAEARFHPVRLIATEISPTARWWVGDMFDPTRLVDQADRPIIDNSHVNKNYLDYLKELVYTMAEKKYGKNFMSLVSDSNPLTFEIRGNEYNDNYAGTTETANGFVERLFRPHGQVETTLGSFIANIYPSGIVVTDTYDFEVSNLQNPASAYGIIRNLSNYTNTKDYLPYYQRSPVVLTIPTGGKENVQKINDLKDEYVKQAREKQERSREFAKTPEGQRYYKDAQKQYERGRAHQMRRIINNLID